jgi:hypothetical protein
LANFYHSLAGKCLLHCQTKSVLLTYTVGPIKGTRIRQLSVWLRFVLLWGLLTWIPYQLSVFLNSCCLPFWCPHQCITTTHLGAHTATSNYRISCLYFKTLWRTQTMSSYPKISFSHQDISGHQHMHCRAANLGKLHQVAWLNRPPGCSRNLAAGSRLLQLSLGFHVHIERWASSHLADPGQGHLWVPLNFFKGLYCSSPHIMGFYSSPFVAS